MRNLSKGQKRDGKKERKLVKRASPGHTDEQRGHTETTLSVTSNSSDPNETVSPLGSPRLLVQHIFSSTTKLIDDAGGNLLELGHRVKHFFHHQVPDHLRDNPHIITGYRAHYTFSECAKSIFSIHNETGNIWTHLIGAVFFLGCLYFALSGLPPHAALSDYLMMSVFVMSAVLCLLCSTTFHTFSAHKSIGVYSATAVLDYCGISLLIFGSFTILIHYSLYCFRGWRIFYITCLSISCLIGLIMPWFSFFRDHAYRVWRVVFFVTKGFIAAVGVIHGIYLSGWQFVKAHMSIEFLLMEVVLYLLGAYIYAARIPEVWFPGRLDHWFHSHQIWHVLIVLAAYCHYRASIPLAHIRLTYDTCDSILGASGAYNPAVGILPFSV
jgi:adiponectin receptor